MKKRFLLVNPLIVQEVARYIVENKKTEISFRSKKTGLINKEVDLSKLMLMIDDLNGQMPIEIPLVGGKALSADLAEDVFI